MNLLQLKYFQTVARLEHMTQAARTLSIVQPSLSQTIAHLEDELGVPLKVLGLVEPLIGPNIALWSSNFTCKDPYTGRPTL